MDSQNFKNTKLNFSWQKHMVLISSTVATAALLLWTEGRTSPPVYCSVQLPWQPASSPLSGDEREQRDCREHPPLLCFTLDFLCSLLTFIFVLRCPSFPSFFFFYLICDPWSAWQWVLPSSGAVMSIPSAVTVPVTAMLAGAERDRIWDKQTHGFGSVWGSSGRVDSVVACFPSCCLPNQAHFQRSSQLKRRWQMEMKTKWLINEQHGWGRESKDKKMIDGD